MELTTMSSGCQKEQIIRQSRGKIKLRDVQSISIVTQQRGYLKKKKKQSLHRTGKSPYPN
jgi:hypothetical protein